MAQVKSIQDAITEKKDIFDFMGAAIPMNPTIGYFITMNPGLGHYFITFINYPHRRLERWSIASFDRWWTTIGTPSGHDGCPQPFHSMGVVAMKTIEKL